MPEKIHTERLLVLEVLCRRVSGLMSGTGLMHSVCKCFLYTLHVILTKDNMYLLYKYWFYCMTSDLYSFIFAVLKHPYMHLMYINRPLKPVHNAQKMWEI